MKTQIKLHLKIQFSLEWIRFDFQLTNSLFLSTNLVDRTCLVIEISNMMKKFESSLLL